MHVRAYLRVQVGVRACARMSMRCVSARISVGKRTRVLECVWERARKRLRECLHTHVCA